MPTAPPSRCGYPGCPHQAADGHGKCPDHERQAWQHQPGDAWANGGSRRWRKARAKQLRTHPLCEQCQTEGHPVIAVTVDHIRNLATGGDMWDPANHASLCHRHHAEKTARESADGRRRTR